jgi:hypothetical protein
VIGLGPTDEEEARERGTRVAVRVVWLVRGTIAWEKSDGTARAHADAHPD